MKKFNKLAFILSFMLLTFACSFISISSVAENHRWALESINPWNGIEGVAFVIGYFLRTGYFTYVITVGLFLLLWWAVYLLFSYIMKIGSRQ